MLVALADGRGIGVLRSMTPPTAVAGLGTPVGIITSCDGLGRGVLRSMTPPTALAGLFSEDGKAKLRTIGDSVSSVCSDGLLGVKYSTPHSAAFRRSSESRRATHLS